MVKSIGPRNLAAFGRLQFRRLSFPRRSIGDESNPNLLQIKSYPGLKPSSQQQPLVKVAPRPTLEDARQQYQHLLTKRCRSELHLKKRGVLPELDTITLKAGPHQSLLLLLKR